jgi:hypothetical protein
MRHGGSTFILQGARNVAVKLLMTWDILPGREQEYFEFVVRDFIPGVQHMGMEPSDAWYTMYGNQPQIMAAVQMNSVTTLQRTLDQKSGRPWFNA